MPDRLPASSRLASPPATTTHTKPQLPHNTPQVLPATRERSTRGRGPTRRPASRSRQASRTEPASGPSSTRLRHTRRESRQSSLFAPGAPYGTGGPGAAHCRRVVVWPCRLMPPVARAIAAPALRTGPPTALHSRPGRRTALGTMPAGPLRSNQRVARAQGRQGKPGRPTDGTAERRPCHEKPRHHARSRRSEARFRANASLDCRLATTHL